MWGADVRGHERSGYGVTHPEQAAAAPPFPAWRGMNGSQETKRATRDRNRRKAWGLTTATPSPCVLHGHSQPMSVLFGEGGAY